MKKHISRLIIIASLQLLASPLVVRAADQASPTELKLREALKNTMLQLRNVQNDNATLQAQQAEDQDKIKTLTTQVDTLTKQSILDKQTADSLISTLKQKSTTQDAQIAKLEEALAKWKAGYELIKKAALEKEAERAKSASQVIVLQRKSDDLEAKNIQLYDIGTEILDRYQKYSIGDAIMAKEPFTGIMRVRLQNQVQDYQDKLLNQKGTANASASPSPAAGHPAGSAAPAPKQSSSPAPRGD